MSLKNFSIIQHGGLFDGIDGEGPTGIDIAATHKERDRFLINRIKVFGEILRCGMADPRQVGQNLIDLAAEAEELEKLVIFGYE